MTGHVYSAKEFKKILIANGYFYVRTNGSHSIYKKESETIVITLNLNPLICKRLIKENDLKVYNRR